ncbi:hypothetical protein D3C77_404300 [compost metagenome]
MGTGDLGDVVGPVFPVVAVAALGDDLGVDGLLDFTHFVGQLGLLGHLAFDIVLSAFLADAVLAFACLAVAGAASFPGLLLGLVGDGDDFHLARVRADQVELVDHGVEAVVVRPQCLQHLPNHFVGLVVIERFVGLHAGRNDHGQHHIATLLTRCVAHYPANGLHHVHLGITRGEEENGVQRRYVHTFRQAAHVAEDAAGVGWRFFFEPVELGFLSTCVHAAIDVCGFADNA